MPAPLVHVVTRRTVRKTGCRLKEKLCRRATCAGGDLYVEGDRKASWLFLNLLCALIEAYDGGQPIHVILNYYIIASHRR